MINILEETARKMQKEFYSGGLKFSCRRCSACCRGESGFVFLSREDLERLASRLQMEEGRFVETYCRWAPGEGGGRLSLKEKENFDCVFWDSGCALYGERPLQCRAYPFWQAVLESRRSWEDAAKSCPGMNSGKKRGAEEIVSYINRAKGQNIIEKHDYKQRDREP